MAIWLVQFLGLDEFQLRNGDTQTEVMYPDEITGRPAVDARPEDFFPLDRWSIHTREINGVTLVTVTPKH